MPCYMGGMSEKTISNITILPVERMRQPGTRVTHATPRPAQEKPISATQQMHECVEHVLRQVGSPSARALISYYTQSGMLEAHGLTPYEFCMVAAPMMVGNAGLPLDDDAIARLRATFLQSPDLRAMHDAVSNADKADMWRIQAQVENRVRPTRDRARAEKGARGEHRQYMREECGMKRWQYGDLSREIDLAVGVALAGFNPRFAGHHR